MIHIAAVQGELGGVLESSPSTWLGLHSDGLQLAKLEDTIHVSQCGNDWLCHKSFSGSCLETKLPDLLSLTTNLGYVPTT